MVKVANLKDIPTGGSKLIFLNDKPVALFNLEGKIIAWDNRCPHRGASLSDSIISKKTIKCKYHFWEFDIRTGCAVANNKVKVEVYNVTVKDKSVYLSTGK